MNIKGGKIRQEKDEGSGFKISRVYQTALRFKTGFYIFKMNIVYFLLDENNKEIWHGGRI